MADRGNYVSAESIWFEIWGSWIRVKTFNFPANFLKILINFQANFQKISICPRKFLKNFDFFRQIFIFQENIFECPFSWAETWRRIWGGPKKISRPNFRENFHFQGKNVHFQGKNF